MSELTTIIRNMEAAGESRERIASVVKHYNENKESQEDFPADEEVKEDPSQEDATVEGSVTASNGEESSTATPVDNGDGSEEKPLKHKKKQYVKRADGWYFKPEFLGQREFKIEDKNLLGELNGKVDPNAVTSDIIKATTPTLEAPVVDVDAAVDNVYELEDQFEKELKKEKTNFATDDKNELFDEIQEEHNAIDDPENKKKLEKSRDEEFNGVVGYYEDGVFIPGTYTNEKSRLEGEIEQTLQLPNAGMANRGMYNEASNPLYFQEQAKANLESNEEVSQDVQFKTLDKALHQVSIYDFAEKNGIEPKDVDTTSGEFKAFKYKTEDLSGNEELYNRVNEQYIHQASEVDKTEEKRKVAQKIITEQAHKDMGKDEGVLGQVLTKEFWTTFYDTERNDELEQYSKEKLEKYQPLLDKVIKSSSDIGKKIEDLTTSVTADVKWVTENDPTEELEKITSKTYKTQKEADKANADYARITGEYNDRLNRLKNNVGNIKALRTTLDDSLDVAGKIGAKVGNIEIVNDLSGDYYGTIYNASSRAVAATAEFITGTDEFTRRFNPMLALDADEVPEILKGTVEYLQQTSLLDMPSVMGYADFKRNGPNEGALREGLDAISKDARAKQTDYADADWATSTFMSMAEMTPQILVGMTGVGTLGTLSSMIVSSTGNNFIRFEEEGMSGVDLYSRASFHGLMEGISETVTSKFGARTLKGLAVPSAATNTFKKYFANAIGLGKTVALEGGIEGLSEGFNSFATNAYDKYVVGKDINLWDGVGEAFYQGASVSVGFKGPAIMKQVFTPFISSQNNASLGEISKQILEADAALLNPNLTEVAKKALINKQARLIEKSETLYDQAITKSASFTVEERQELIDIEVSNHNLKRDAKAIQADPGLTDKQKDSAIKELSDKYNEQIGKKQDIIARHDKITPQEAKQKWDNQVAYLKNQAKLAEDAGALPINVQTVTTKQMEDIMVDNDMGIISEAATEVQALEDIVNDPKSTQAEIDDAKKLLDPDGNKGQAIKNYMNMLSGQASNYGGMMPVIKDGKVVSYELYLNEETSISDGYLNTGAHEFVHAAFHQTLQKDAGAQEVFGAALTDILQNDKNVTFTERGMETLNRRKSQYTRNEGRGEEIMAITSELMQDGDVTMNEKGLDLVKGVFRRFVQNNLGSKSVDIKFDTPQDVKNFMIDYHKSIANNKPSPAIARMTAKGAKGKLVDKATAESDATARGEEMQFSKSVSLNMKANPDLRSDIDGFVMKDDGSPKHTNNADFQLSPDFGDAYMKIVDSKLLDGMIHQGMIGKGLDPGSLKEFTRKVKDKVGERFMKNYNLDKNDSLFGWLTGVSGGAGKSIIYRAKGDVMAEYVKEGKAEQTSLDKKIGEAGTLADILQAEKSTEMERIENEDMSPGRKDAYVNGPVPVLDQFGLTDTKNTVDNAIDKIQKNQETKVDLDGLKYKGVKGLLVDASKVDKNGKMKAPTKASDVKPTGVLYPVLKAVAEVIGVDPKRIIANQDLNDTQRRAAQRFFYNKIVNEDGSFNKTFLEEVLPEGETRSGEATGIANTKLGLLYDKGGRASFAEGATAAGKATQTKRTDVTMEEILGVFGINPDGTFQSGTGSDGALRQGILQVAQLAGNQALRENALKNGTHSEAVVAMLSDGKAEYAWSRDNVNPQPTTQDIIDQGWNDFTDLVSTVAPLNKSIISEAMQAVWGTALNNNVKSKVLEVTNKALGRFTPLDPDTKELVEKTPMEVSPADLTDVMRQEWEFDQSNQSMKNTYGFSGGVTDVFNDPSGVSGTKLRSHITDNAKNTYDSNNPAASAESLFMLAPGLAGNGAYGNGQVLKPSKDGGGLIKGISTKTAKGIEVNRSNRQGYQPTGGITDLVALWNNADVPKAPNGKWIQPSKTKGVTYEVWDGKAWAPAKTKMLAENTGAFLKDQDFDGREKQSLAARAASKNILDAAWQKVKKGDWSMKEFAALQTSLGSNMQSPLRRSAAGNGIQTNITDVISRGKSKGISVGKSTQFEHNTALQKLNARIGQSYMNTGKLNNDVWDGYHVNVISASLNKAMDKAGFQTNEAGIVGDSRMYNPHTLKWLIANNGKIVDGVEINLDDIGTITDKNGDILGQDFVNAINSYKETISLQGLNQMQFSKIATKANAASYANNPRGISVLDFDDTLATSNSKVISTSPDGTIRELTAEQFAKEGADLLDQGWTHDFSEFNKVVDGKVASLFQKALKLQEKFGNDNMFILTARPQQSAQSIFQFLKANGLNIPLKNITGLANSTAQAKADWIADKVGEGYNDFYFADDAMQNVDAVKNMLDQFDVKSKVQQAKIQFSKSVKQELNDMLQETTGIESDKQFSDAQAKLRGRDTKYKGIIPASAQDFKGLLYNFISKGKKGDAQLAFLKKALIDPFARGIDGLNTARQNTAQDYKNLLKNSDITKGDLNQQIEGLDYNYDQAVRAYLWTKAGFEIPGMSQRDANALNSVVMNDSQMLAFAEAVGVMSGKETGLSQPNDYWLAENLTSDLLSDGSIGDARAEHLKEWQDNVDQMFDKEGLNKIESIYGSKFREALEDSLYRMKNGKNRTSGGSRLVNGYMNWVNNSVGAIMFFNMRSAILQTISATNYINWSFNNPAKAAAAFANQPQYWKDFSMIFNSPYLKQRRAGNQRGVNEAELSAAVANSDNKAKAAIAWLLKKGFLPTQIADSFAIASGGATFFRNKVKALVKEGMTQEQAEKQAFLDFQESTEVSQQSARPDMISQQQASPLGRLILSFQNTPMQYARIMNKAARDLVNGRGDTKTHLSKIAYYGVVQSIVFGALQSALFAAMGDDEEEEFDMKKGRIINGMIDSVLSGIGYGGKAISAVKNTIREYAKQESKGWNADHTYTILQLLGFSPPIGSKLRKIYGSIQNKKFNEGVYKKRGFTLDNPIWSGIGNVVEGITNVPLGRISQKLLNIDNALDDNNKWWERTALLLGWNTWDLGIKDPDIEAVKEEIKTEKKVETKKKQKIKKEQKKKEKIEENKSVIEENKKKSKKDGVCSAVSKGGSRCKTKVVEGKLFCTVHEETEQRSDGKKTQCRKRKSDKTRCKMQTTNKSGYCYYHD